MKFQIELRGKDLGILDLDDLTMDEAMQLEDRTGLALGDVGNGLGRLSARAIQALVWLHQYHNGNLAAVQHDNFKFGEVKIQPIADEDPTEAAPAALTPVDDPSTGSGTDGTDTSDSSHMSAA